MAQITCLVFLLSLVAINSTAQEIFRTTDEHGNVIFTDQPPAGTSSSEKVELQQTNTTPATPIPPKAKPGRAATTDEAESTDYEVTITTPPNETTVAMGPGNFSVGARVQPSLGGAQQLQLFIDDIPWGQPQSETIWSLTNIFRGAHDLTVAIVDADGGQLSVSQPIRVYVLRPSINSPARRGRN